MFQTVLVANRGEIAVRILRTLKELGVRSVAVHSPVDAHALHVLEADAAVALPGDAPSDSYLNIEAILAAARATGAQAIHPGYGFLAENAGFARAVTEAGLVFIGPPAEVIAQLGDKPTARRILSKAGVPIIPGQLESEADPRVLAAVAADMGYPVLIKAAAGGGGKGMRVVTEPALLEGAAVEAASEARAAFGDGTIYLEKYLHRPRHVEIQILADGHGHVVHLGERECSVQRRHQKIMEETPCPAPFFDAQLRAKMGAAAVSAAKAVGYVNAGTVEFLLDETGHFYFLEVNTRLQVEHPVTELVYGLDLVRHQLEIAAGAPLAFTQDDLCPRGHALECRIYAEDPASGFLPSPGAVLFHRPAQGPGVRFDSGIYSGAVVPVSYDPILGKLITWAESRDLAIARMDRALRENVVLGVHTATELLRDILAHPAFKAGETHTGFLAEHFATWAPAVAEAKREICLASAAAELLGVGGTPGTGAAHDIAGAGTSEARHLFPSPWHTLRGFDSARG